MFILTFILLILIGVNTKNSLSSSNEQMKSLDFYNTQKKKENDNQSFNDILNFKEKTSIYEKVKKIFLTINELLFNENSNHDED